MYVPLVIPSLFVPSYSKYYVVHLLYLEVVYITLSLTHGYAMYILHQSTVSNTIGPGPGVTLHVCILKYAYMYVIFFPFFFRGLFFHLIFQANFSKTGAQQVSHDFLDCMDPRYLRAMWLVKKNSVMGHGTG